MQNENARNRIFAKSLFILKWKHNYYENPEINRMTQNKHNITKFCVHWFFFIKECGRKSKLLKITDLWQIFQL